MAFTYKSGSSTTNSGNSTAPSTGTITAPSEGDLVVVGVHSNSASGISHGGGEGTAFTEAYDAAVASETSQMALYWKVAGASEPTSYTFAAGNAEWRVCVKTFSALSDAVVDQGAAFAREGSKTQNITISAGNGTAVADDAVSIVFGGKDNRSTAETYTTADNSYVSVLGSTGDQATAMAHRIWTTGANDSTIVITTADSADGANDNGYGIHISFVEGATDPTPDPDALALAGQTPTPTFQYTIEPDTGSINIYKYIGLKLDGFPPTVDVASASVTREPGLVALNIAEQTPTVQHNRLAAPDKDDLALSGKIPTVVVSNIVLPATVTLDISEKTPTAPVANTREPSTVALDIAEQTPVRLVGDFRTPDKVDLTIAEQTPTVQHNRLADVPVGSLTIDEKTPVRSVGQFRTPDTVALDIAEQTPTVQHNRLADVPVGSLTIDEKTPVRSVAQTREPSTVALDIAEQTPTLQHNRLADVPLGTLTLDGKTPSTGATSERQPDTDALALSGKVPIVVVNNITIPAIDELAFTGYAPISSEAKSENPLLGSLALSGKVPITVVNNIVTPDKDELTITGTTPRINDIDIEVPTGSLNIWKYIGLKLDGFPPTLSYNYIPVPDKDELTLSGQAPTLNVTVLPTTDALSLSGKTPDLVGVVYPTTGTLTLQGYPTVDQDTVAVPVGALTLSGAAPTLKGVEQPTTGSLTLSGKVPTVDYAQSPDMALGTLTLSGKVPTAPIALTVAPATGTLTLSGKKPEAGQDSIITLKGTLTLGGKVPTTYVQLFVDSGGSDSLALSGQAPTVVEADADKTVDPGTGSLVLFSTVLQNQPTVAQLSISGNPVTIFYRDGTLIENPNATTAVPSNYEQCDFTGFRQMPGSLKMTWNKHAVRRKSWEERHPQDVVQSVPERQKGSKRPEQADTFIDTLYPDGVDPDDL